MKLVMPHYCIILRMLHTCCHIHTLYISLGQLCNRQKKLTVERKSPDKKYNYAVVLEYLPQQTLSHTIDTPLNWNNQQQSGDELVII